MYKCREMEETKRKERVKRCENGQSDEREKQEEHTEALL